ncbi:MAG: hypothetical protein ACOYY2_03255 [Actinomycetota bacterium]
MGMPRVPMPHLSMPRLGVPRLPMPPVPRMTRDELARATEAVRANLPPADRLAFYSGLGLLAALQVVDWPVATAIGVGTWVARRSRNGGPRPGPGRTGGADRTSSDRTSSDRTSSDRTGADRTSLDRTSTA